MEFDPVIPQNIGFEIHGNRFVYWESYPATEENREAAANTMDILGLMDPKDIRVTTEEKDGNLLLREEGEVTPGAIGNLVFGLLVQFRLRSSNNQKLELAVWLIRLLFGDLDSTAEQLVSDTFRKSPDRKGDDR